MKLSKIKQKYITNINNNIFELSAKLLQNLHLESKN